MQIIKSGVKLSAAQLSQGEKSLMALVGDLARRLTLLNPSRDNPLDGNGIVLIDEIDLHLHPSWQQTVIQKLTTTFANIQFILTTHSPQVLSTVRKTQIRQLTVNQLEQPIAAEPPCETYAHPSADVMKTVMEVDAIANLPELAQLEQYRNLVEQGDLDNPQISEQIAQVQQLLEQNLGVHHPELIAIEMVKRRREILG